MKQYKLRRIVMSGSKEKSGITLPSEIILRFGLGTLFNIEVSGNSILLTSGCQQTVTTQQVEKFNLRELEVIKL